MATDSPGPGRRQRLRRGLLFLCVAFFVAAGFAHFLAPEFYEAITPSWVPFPEVTHRVAGVCEALGALGLLVPRRRRLAALGLCLLLLAVFPANIYAALHDIALPGMGSPWMLWARLPLQALFLAWVYWVGVLPWGPPPGAGTPAATTPITSS